MNLIIYIILYINIILSYVNAIKSQGPVVGNLSSVPLFSVVHQSGHPLVLTSSGQQYTLYFSNPYDSISLLTELLQSNINRKRTNLWNIKVTSLDSWLDNVINTKKNGIQHKLVKSSIDSDDNINEFKVYFNNNLKVDGKILIFMDINDLKDEVDRMFDDGLKSKIINNIESISLNKLLSDGKFNIDKYLFVPSKQSLDFIASRRI